MSIVIVNQIEQVLKEKKIKKKDFLEAVGLSINTFANWKKRNTVPSAAVVNKIAEYLGVSTDYLPGKESEPINNNELAPFTEEEKLLLDMFRKMDLIQKAKLITFAAELMEKD